MFFKQSTKAIKLAQKQEKEMEKFYAFLPSLLIIACIAGAAFLCVKLATRRFGTNLKSVEWNKKNRFKVALTIGLPSILIFAPTAEELIFRAPLIIVFGSMSPVAWYALLVSSAIFSLIHWFRKVWLVPNLSSAKECTECESDDMAAEVNRLQKKNKKTVVVMKVASLIFTLFAGLLFGYLGITYQSIWLCVGLHAVWNLTVPILLPIVMQLLALLILLAFEGVHFLYYRVQRKIRMRRRGKTYRYTVVRYSNPR